jgi:hypothetical protein
MEAICMIAACQRASVLSASPRPQHSHIDDFVSHPSDQAHLPGLHQ